MTLQTNYSDMHTHAIWLNFEDLNTLFDQAIENKVKSIKNAITNESLESYMSEKVLPHLAPKILKERKEQISNFINKVRLYMKIDYNPLIIKILAEYPYTIKDNPLEIIKEIQKFAKEDKFEFNYQKLLAETEMRQCYRLRNYLKKCADEINYKFDFKALIKISKDPRAYIEWATLTNQTIKINVQKNLEKMNWYYFNQNLAKFYLEFAKKTDKVIDFNKILDLIKTKEEESFIKKYIPKDYAITKYSEKLEIDITKNENLADIIGFLYDTSSIDYVLYEGREYQQNEEYSTDNNEIVPINPDEVVYVMDYDPKRTEWTKYINGDLIRNMQHLDLNNIKITGCEKMVIENIRGINEDECGATFCRVRLDFYPIVELKLPVNLNELSIALHRLKSHKWDYWYERYMDSKITFSNNAVKVELDFDHRS